MPAKRFKITNLRTGVSIAENAAIADNPLTRLRGLLGKQSFAPEDALIIKPCKQVHMLMMRFAIDVVFCSPDNRAIFVCKNLKPWRISKMIFESAYVIELPSGRTAEVEVGDEFSIAAVIS